MNNPKVKLMITGAEQSREETYLRGNDRYTHDSDTLTALKDYAGLKKSDYGTPDVVFLFTGRDVVTDDENGKISTNGLGIAYLGGVCTEAFVGLGEDRPGYYSGMFTFSHEMGHLLGAQHDGSSTVPLVPGYVGSQGCPWDDGFLMSYKDLGANHQHFSRCSLLQMRLVITYRGRTCWAVLAVGQAEVDYYPGNVMSIDDACKAVFPEQPSVTAEMIFSRNEECKLKCSYRKHEQGGIYIYSRNTTVPDYAPCKGNKVCVRGRCIVDSRGKGNRPQNPQPSRRPVTRKPTTTTTTTQVPWWKGWWRQRY